MIVFIHLVPAAQEVYIKTVIVTSIIKGHIKVVIIIIQHNDIPGVIEHIAGHDMAIKTRFLSQQAESQRITLTDGRAFHDRIEGVMTIKFKIIIAMRNQPVMQIDKFA